MFSFRQLFTITLFITSFWLLTACTLIVPQRAGLSLPPQPSSELPTTEINDEPAIRAIINDSWTKLVQPSLSYKMTVTMTGAEFSSLDHTAFFEVVDQKQMYSKDMFFTNRRPKGYECIQLGNDSYVNLGAGWELASSIAAATSEISYAYPCNETLSFFLVDPYSIPVYGPNVHPIFKSIKFEHQAKDVSNNQHYDVYQIWQLTDGIHVSCTSRVWIDPTSGLLRRIEYINVMVQFFYPWSFTRVIEYDKSIKIEKPTLQ